MGSQQLLLIVLGMVITGIAITVAITMFQANAIESSRSAMIEDMLFLAGRARDFYLRPASLGGGGRNFTGITIRQITSMTENDNGRYFIAGVSQHQLVIGAIGKVVVNEDSIEVQMEINEQSNTIRIIH
jgi:hypothetical protein